MGNGLAKEKGKRGSEDGADGTRGSEGRRRGENGEQRGEVQTAGRGWRGMDEDEGCRGGMKRRSGAMRCKGEWRAGRNDTERITEKRRVHNMDDATPRSKTAKWRLAQQTGVHKASQMERPSYAQMEECGGRNTHLIVRERNLAVHGTSPSATVYGLVVEHERKTGFPVRQLQRHARRSSKCHTVFLRGSATMRRGKERAAVGPRPEKAQLHVVSVTVGPARLVLGCGRCRESAEAVMWSC
ncbi:hypothetical protein C8J57DRAFT_1212253 [Mycena rebaudengoi]|nr:hypothetical protein C8J57DRAFT_1212253 [Mycena rebaudengoi]